MTPHLDDADLFDLALGTGNPLHLDACPRCRAALAEARDAVHLLPLALAPARPSARLRVRLFAALPGAASRYAGRVADLLGAPAADIAAALARVDAGDLAWQPVLPGIDHYGLRPARGRECGLIRAAAGVHFPYHRHRGEERVIVLQGGCTDSAGHELGPGDEVHHTAGTGHWLEIYADGPLVFAYTSDGSEFAAAPA